MLKNQWYCIFFLSVDLISAYSNPVETGSKYIMEKVCSLMLFRFLFVARMLLVNYNKVIASIIKRTERLKAFNPFTIKLINVVTHPLTSISNTYIQQKKYYFS